MALGTTFAGICKGTTKSGTPCRHIVVFANGYCRQHGGESLEYDREFAKREAARFEYNRERLLKKAGRFERRMLRLWIKPLA